MMALVERGNDLTCLHPNVEQELWLYRKGSEIRTQTNPGGIEFTKKGQ